MAKFFGVADLNDIERKQFVDKWLTRAQKMHNDDFLLTRCRRRGTRLEYSREGRLPNMTLSAAQQQRRSAAVADVTDAPCVLLVFFCRATHSEARHC